MPVLRFRALFVDLAVWAGLACTFAVIVMLVGYLNQPPTAADFRANALQALAASCLGARATAALHPDMRQDVCQCTVSQADFPYVKLNDRDFGVCRQRAAARMESHPDLETAYAANFPALCGVLERGFSGTETDGNSEFCGCIDAQIGEDLTVKASYAFGTGEGNTDERDERVKACGRFLTFGEGWKSTGAASAGMRMPPFMPHHDLVLRCDPRGVVFEVRGGGRVIDGFLAFYDDDDSELPVKSGPGQVLPPFSYSLVEKLGTRDAIMMGAGDAVYRISLAGFAAAAAPVLTHCPDPALREVVAVAPSDAPDPWSTLDGGYIAVREDEGLNWWGSLICDSSPTYFTVQGEIVEEAMGRFPDTSGTFLAAGVPVTVTGDDGTLFEDHVSCDWGAKEGDSQSCFINLDEARLDQLFASGGVTFAVDGTALDRVAFAASPAVQSAQAACYRNTRPLP